ncbi:MAG: hypothetical protein ACLPPV_08650, partial [Candidatus Korobacteraceae bacterium]
MNIIPKAAKLACVWRITDFPRISNSPHTYMDRSRAQGCLWTLVNDDPVAVIYSASLSGAISRAPG